MLTPPTLPEQLVVPVVARLIRHVRSLRMKPCWPVPPPDSQYVLNVAAGAGEDPLKMLNSVVPGVVYQGWRLRSVRGRDVALERDKQSVVLSLPEPGAEGTATTPVAAMPSAVVPLPAAPGQIRPAPRLIVPANNSTMEEEQAPSLPGRRR